MANVSGLLYKILFSEDCVSSSSICRALDTILNSLIFLSTTTLSQAVRGLLRFIPSSEASEACSRRNCAMRLEIELGIDSCRMEVLVDGRERKSEAEGDEVDCFMIFVSVGCGNMSNNVPNFDRPSHKGFQSFLC
jgi:hypothetical protein